MDRFIAYCSCNKNLLDIHLKSNMDRFIAWNNYDTKELICI